MSTIINANNRNAKVTNDTSRKLASTWRLEGDYFEGCNCDILCPCSFFKDPDEGSCYVSCPWHIQKGVYDDTNLDNMNVVAMFNSPAIWLTVQNGKRHYI
jgi:hypothetical protein